MPTVIAHMGKKFRGEIILDLSPSLRVSLDSRPRDGGGVAEGGAESSDSGFSSQAKQLRQTRYSGGKDAFLADSRKAADCVAGFSSSRGILKRPFLKPEASKGRIQPITGHLVSRM